MKELKPRIHENGIDYILVASGYTPDALAGAKPQHPPAPKGEKGV